MPTTRMTWLCLAMGSMFFLNASTHAQPGYQPPMGNNPMMQPFQQPMIQPFQMPMPTPYTPPRVDPFEGMRNMGPSSQEMTWSCSSCNREISRGPTPPTLSRCPYCGIRIIGTDDGSGTSVSASGAAYAIGRIVGGLMGIALIGLLIAGGVKFVKSMTTPTKKKKRKKKRPLRTDDDYDPNYSPPER